MVIIFLDKDKHIEHFDSYIYETINDAITKTVTNVFFCYQIIYETYIQTFACLFKYGTQQKMFIGTKHRVKYIHLNIRFKGHVLVSFVFLNCRNLLVNAMVMIVRLIRHVFLMEWITSVYHYLSKYLKVRWIYHPIFCY